MPWTVIGWVSIRRSDQVSKGDTKSIDWTARPIKTCPSKIRYWHNLRLHVSFNYLLDKTHRGDENYLELITSEHKLIKNELGVLKNLGSCENVERDLFSTFSQTLRNAHEVSITLK